jgi:formylmethanofuran dehydrogenase subunit E
MAQLGLKLLNLTEEDKREYLVVFVENDKCPADESK